jgi:hypothetical protein
LLFFFERFFSMADDGGLPTPTEAMQEEEEATEEEAMQVETEAESDAYVCGANESGQLGVPPTDTLLAPLSLSSLSAGVRVAQVALGFCHSLWRSDEGQVYAAGDNASGQCGVHQPDVLAAPLRLEALATKTVTWVAAGFSHSAVVTSDGALLTFGESDYGQCGHGEAAPLDVRRPRLVRASFGPLASVSCGGVHTLALDRYGGVWTFGCGLHGELGLGDFESRTLPTLVSAVSSSVVVCLAAGERHSLAVCMQGRVLAWGCGKHGALGLPLLSPSDAGLAVPRPVPALAGRVALQVCAGSDWSCVLLQGGHVMQWGRGVRPAGESGAASASAAGAGDNPVGESATDETERRSGVTDGLFSEPRLFSEPADLSSEPASSGCGTPVPVPLPGFARFIAAGHSHGLVLVGGANRALGEADADSRDVLPPPAVYSWGVGRHGEPSISGASLDRPALLPLPAGARPRAVAAGGHGSIILTGAGEEVPNPPRPYVLSAKGAKRLAEEGRWAELAQEAGAVLSSVALVAACFGRGGAGVGEGKGVVGDAVAGDVSNGPSPPRLSPAPSGQRDASPPRRQPLPPSLGKVSAFDSAGLEATYVILMRTYDSAPEVVASLRSSIPRLLARLTPLLQAPPPPNGSAPAAVAMLALLQNPMLSHASEETHAISLGKLVGALSHERREVAVAMLATAPPEVRARARPSRARILLGTHFPARRTPVNPLCPFVPIRPTSHLAPLPTSLRPPLRPFLHTPRCPSRRCATSRRAPPLGCFTPLHS